MILDVAARTTLADYFVIVSGRSHIQTRSIVDAIIESTKADGEHTVRQEGYSEGTWVLLDFGAIVVHVFTPEQRAFYNLERLWGVSTEQRRNGS